ncbi:MAG: hypothetical protein H7A24_09520 [Leptospiraceae bacterium]|nr:hypothetical protein [Leptospiraceae bacterium]MCP5512109.1 hypothetical protein [Leptospiraceae bacterium]
MKFISISFIFLVLHCTQANVPSHQVRVGLKWKSKNFPLKMQVYLPDPKKEIVLWETGTVKSKNDLRIIKDSELTDFLISPEEKKDLVLVSENKTDLEVIFFAAPHHVSPEENALGFTFKCLCVNHYFRVLPGEIWYRNIQLKLDKNFIGDKIQFEHSLIGIDPERFREMSDEEN